MRENEVRIKEGGSVKKGIFEYMYSSILPDHFDVRAGDGPYERKVESR